MLTRKLPCPSCGVGLKIAEDLPAGRKITCPKCGNDFPVPEKNGQASAVQEPGVRVRKPAPEEYGEEDAVDQKEVEERPVVRKRRRPPPPEDDSEPEDEEEERPRPRKRRKLKKKKPPSRMPLILGLVIGGIVLLGAGVALAVVLWPKDKSTSTAQNSPASRPSRMPGGGARGMGRGGEGAAERTTPPAGQESAEPKSSESGSDGGSSDPYAAGKQVFQTKCVRCHRIGDSAGGRQGPNLATIGQTRDVDWLMGFIRDPKSRKPDSRMRPVGLSDEDLRAVAVYLASLK